jgi:hypothetical protein
VPQEAVRDFFAWSDRLDHDVLRPLSHIRSNWEIRWDHDGQRYFTEDDSFAQELNETIERIAKTDPPTRYHDNEDRLAEFARDRLKWKIRKFGNRWANESGKPWAIADYAAALEQGGFSDIDAQHLFYTASGRVHAAIRRDQKHFDQMEDTHREMLGEILAIIIYHRECGNW